MTELMKQASDLAYDLRRVSSGQSPIATGNPDLLSGFKQFLERHPQLSPDTQNMLYVLPMLLELQAQKSAVYGRSYCRHGDLSIFLNVERKWDRIANIMEKAMKDGTGSLYETGTPTETFVDTVVDLASYGLLWIGYIMETHPEAFQKFMESNELAQQNTHGNHLTMNP